MESRQKLFVGIGVCAGLVIVFFLAYRVFAPSKPGTVKNTGGEPTATSTPIGGTALRPDPALEIPRVPGVVDGIYLRQMARMVVEWSGSYSNQNGNQHIDIVSPFVTEKFLNFLQKQSPNVSDDYVGVTTQVIVSSLVEKKDTEATVSVGVQQSVSNTSSSVYRNGSVHMINDGGVWKVDGIFWDKK
jgi:hypothetical protein